MNEQKFNEWCIIELMGHSVIAGIVSEQAIGGETFIRIDVPEVSGRQAYTKLFGKGAIYAMTPTDESTCRCFIANTYQPPVSRYLLETHEEQESGGDIPI